MHPFALRHLNTYFKMGGKRDKYVRETEISPQSPVKQRLLGGDCPCAGVKVTWGM
jgi:hypothetical protein